MTQSLNAIWGRAIVGTIITATLVFGAVVWLSVGPLVQRWQRETGARVHDSYGEALHRLVAITGQLNRRDVRDLLEPEAQPGTVAIVWDGDGNLLFWSRDGDTLTLLPPSIAEAIRSPQLAETYAALSPLRVDGVRVSAAGTIDHYAADGRAPILLNAYRNAGLVSEVRAINRDSGPVGYFVAGVISQGPTSPSGGLLRALLIAVLAAIAATVGIALILMVRASRRIARAVAAVLHQLEALVAAHPRGALPGASVTVREFEVVAHQIATIGDQLTTEREVRHRWAQDIAHDLRTPIAALRAQLEGMIDGVLDRSDDRLERLAGSLTQLESLAQSFLLLTKLESPDYPVRLEQVGLAGLVHSAVIQHTPRAEQLAKPISVTVDPALPRSIEADPGLITRAVHNLIDNALHHGEPGPVTVSLYPERHADVGTTGCIALTNAGALNRAVAANPFDRFARSGDSHGHGLGLSVVHAVAQLHSGRAWITDSGGGHVTAGFSAGIAAADR
jgi:signal transduction histidine kinase